MEIGSRRIWLGGMTHHADSAWMRQARNAGMQETGYLNGCWYLLHDRDQKFRGAFATTLAAGWGAMPRTTGAQPESERPCGALGAVDQNRMSVDADPIRGGLAAARGGGVP